MIVALTALVAALGGTAVAAVKLDSSTPLKLCVASKEGRPITTPKGGACRTGYTLTEVNKEGPEGQQGPEGKSAPSYVGEADLTVGAAEQKPVLEVPGIIDITANCETMLMTNLGPSAHLYVSRGNPNFYDSEWTVQTVAMEDEVEHRFRVDSGSGPTLQITEGVVDVTWTNHVGSFCVASATAQVFSK